MARQTWHHKGHNGPEYISGKLLIWAEKRGIAIQHIQPGQPQQNIERYNRTVRHEWLDQYIIESIEEAQDHARHLSFKVLVNAWSTFYESPLRGPDNRVIAGQDQSGRSSRNRSI